MNHETVFQLPIDSSNYPSQVNSNMQYRYSIDQFKLRRESDCTHFCNPSPVTWNWVPTVLQIVAESIEDQQ